MTQYLLNFPWFGYAAIAVIVVAASEAGRFLGMRWGRVQPDIPAPELTTLEGAGLGLLALLIGFTFAMTLTRFDARLKGVLEEANAISTAALRARLLPQPHAGEARRLLDDYVRTRLDFARGPRNQASLDAAVRRSNQLQLELWAHAVAVTRDDPHSIPAGLFTASLNQMFDLQEARLAATRNRVPPAVLVLLYGIAVGVVGLSGYVAGLSGRSGRVPHALMALMLATVIALVVDLDRSQSGFITVSQQALLNLEAGLGHGGP